MFIYGKKLTFMGKNLIIIPKNVIKFIIEFVFLVFRERRG